MHRYVASVSESAEGASPRYAKHSRSFPHFQKISTCTIEISWELTEPEALADFLRRGSASLDIAYVFCSTPIARKLSIWYPLDLSQVRSTKPKAFDDDTSYTKTFHIETPPQA